MRHPNILNVFDFGEHQGTQYMIVEYVPGGSLAGRMSQGPLDGATALRFLRGIAAGLDYAHSQGIVHRDVKPANVLLEKDETPVIADFGLAKMLQGSSLASMTGVTTGTPGYMAPEQVTGHEVGPAADRYSLATIAYEMLTGSIPFEGQGVLEVLYAHVHLDPALPSSLNPALSQSVDAVIMRGLAKEPGARWSTCDAFVTALATALGSRAPAPVDRTTVITAPMQRTESPPLFAPPPATVPSPVWPAAAEAARRNSRRRRAVIVAIALLALLALLGGVGYVLADPFKPGFSLSSSSVHAGDVLTVSVRHLPANQDGEVDLLSQVYSFPFRADGNGDATVEVTVPQDVAVGAHVVRLCWNFSCPVQAPLEVIASEGLPTPTPSSAASPSPRSSQSPRTSPKPTPRSSPTATPSAPSISLSSSTIKLGTGTVTVYGQGFAGATAPIRFVQPSINQLVATANVGPYGRFQVTVHIPLRASQGPATIRACSNNGLGPCAHASIAVVLL
jgi:serine/threonine protein kinase